MPNVPTPKTCRNETLAAGPVAKIQRCGECGTLSFHLGATTIRLDPSAAESLWATLSEALAELRCREIDERVQSHPSVGAVRGLS